MTEWQAIVEPNARSYGSCVRTQNTTKVKYMKHFVDSNDTLQGLALKYSTTTDELRRINKLFSNDSIFVRDHLLVPSTSHPSKMNEILNEGGVANQQKSADPKPSSTNNGRSKVIKDSDVKVSVNGVKTEDDEEENDAYSFLRKLDNKIQAGKKAVSQFRTEESQESEQCAQTTLYFNSNTKISATKYGVSSQHLFEL